MAGSYPDTPGRRMAFDADGSVLVTRKGTSLITEWDASYKAALNSEAAAKDPLPFDEGPYPKAVVIFPELREIDGFFGVTDSGIRLVESSADTTNGNDGTWNTEIADFNDNPSGITGTYQYYRTYITSIAASNKRALRFEDFYSVGGANKFFRTAHLYGEIAPGQTPDRLLFIDELTGLEFTGPLDFGDIPRGSSEDRQIRFKNNSAALTANTIQYTTDDLYLGSSSWYVYTTPGGVAFSSVQQIGSLAPATTTAVITLRRIISSAYALGLHASRLYANVASWS